MTDRIVRMPELLKITGYSRPTIYRLMSEGAFPKSLKLGKNSIGWKLSTIQAWMDSLESAA